MINRRTFLTTSAAFGATLAVFPRDVFSVADTVITILHTNDTHSQIDPLPANDRNAGMGGVARRATLDQESREPLRERIAVVARCAYGEFWKQLDITCLKLIGHVS